MFIDEWGEEEDYSVTSAGSVDVMLTPLNPRGGVHSLPSQTETGGSTLHPLTGGGVHSLPSQTQTGGSTLHPLTGGGVHSLPSQTQTGGSTLHPLTGGGVHSLPSQTQTGGSTLHPLTGGGVHSLPSQTQTGGSTLHPLTGGGVHSLPSQTQTGGSTLHPLTGGGVHSLPSQTQTGGSTLHPLTGGGVHSLPSQTQTGGSTLHPLTGGGVHSLPSQTQTGGSTLHPLTGGGVHSLPSQTQTGGSTLHPLTGGGVHSLPSQTQTGGSTLHPLTGGGVHSLPSQTQTGGSTLHPLIGGGVHSLPSQTQTGGSTLHPLTGGGVHSLPSQTGGLMHSLTLTGSSTTPSTLPLLTAPTPVHRSVSHQSLTVPRGNWSSNLSTVNISPFTQPVGPTVNIPSSVVEVFELFFTESICVYIVEQTNMYAREVLGEKYDSWDKVTVGELRAYFGFMLLMGLVSLPALDDYWRRDTFLRYSPIADRISRDRFRDIHRFLHFNSNCNLPLVGEPGHHRLGKVRPVMEALQERFSQLYQPHCENAVDEAMIPFQGRSSLKQYMPAKPVKRGIKAWCRADAVNGYMCQVQIYTGRGDSPEGGLGKRVVLDLSQKLEHKNYHLYFDNFFSSVSLMSELLAKGIYACGTARQNYRDFPSTLKLQGKSKREQERHGLINK